MKAICKTVLLVIMLLISTRPVLYAKDGPRNGLTQGKPVKFENLTIDDGLSQSSVFAIVQDRRGLMWFGTWDGLNRYDGYRFTIYKNDQQNPYSLADNEVRALHLDSLGNLWVGTMGGLCRFDPEKERCVRY